MSKNNFIAIVEDDPFMAEVIKGMISSAALEAEVFLLGKDFLNCIYADKFGVVLLDLSLPDIDGIDLLEMLSAKSMEWKLLLMSGHQAGVISAASLYAKGLGMDVIGVLQKPFSQFELLAAISGA